MSYDVMMTGESQELVEARHRVAVMKRAIARNLRRLAGTVPPAGAWNVTPELRGEMMEVRWSESTRAVAAMLSGVGDRLRCECEAMGKFWA